MSVTHPITPADQDDDPRATALLAIVDRALGDLAHRSTLTVEETARVCGVGRSAMYEACRRGDVPSLRVAGRVVVPVPALAAVLMGAGDDRD